MTSIPLSQPDITEAEINAVCEVMRSGRLSIGPWQTDFENAIAARTRRQHGIAVSSGTAALHLVLQALDIGPGDEVITTPFSFIASANCILYVGAKPVFVDIDPTSLNLDPDRIEAAITPRTKAIIAVEVFGNPVQMDRIAQVARQHEVPLIEDSCEGLGGIYKDTPIGGFGRVGVFGFYPNKQITTGEGGMIVTDDDRLAEMCRSMRNQGRANMGSEKSPGYGNAGGAWLAHERLGYNYRLSELAAAVGVVQMTRLDELLEKRSNVASMYMQQLMTFEDLILPNIPTEVGDVPSWFVFVVRLNTDYTHTERDRVITGMRRHEIGAANYFPCIHLQPFYQKRFGMKEGMFPIAESVSQRTIALPFFTKMDKTHVDLIVHTLKVMLDRERLLKQ